MNEATVYVMKLVIQKVAPSNQFILDIVFKRKS